MTKQRDMQGILTEATNAIGQVTNWQNTSDTLWIGSTGQWRFTASIRDGNCRANAAFGTSPIHLPFQLAAQIQAAITALSTPVSSARP